MDRQRSRLPPSVRVDQIVDAALRAFSQAGYAGARMDDIARGAGAALAERYGHALWPVKGIGHQRKARTVSEQLRALPGVLEADANAAGMVRVEFDREQVSEKDILGALSWLIARGALEHGK